MTTPREKKQSIKSQGKNEQPIVSLGTAEKQVLDRIGKLSGALYAIQQPRSNFQIQHFVIGQHDTPSRQWHQAILELQVKMFVISEKILELEKLNLDIDEIEEDLKKKNIKPRAYARLEIRRKELYLKKQSLEYERIGNLREAETLLYYAEQLPALTYEEFQKAEAEYWDKRLSRQAMLSLRARGAIDEGNLDAIRQLPLTKQFVPLKELAGFIKVEHPEDQPKQMPPPAKRKNVIQKLLRK